MVQIDPPPHPQQALTPNSMRLCEDHSVCQTWVGARCSMSLITLDRGAPDWVYAWGAWSGKPRLRSGRLNRAAGRMAATIAADAAIDRRLEVIRPRLVERPLQVGDEARGERMAAAHAPAGPGGGVAARGLGQGVSERAGEEAARDRSGSLLGSIGNALDPI